MPVLTSVITHATGDVYPASDWNTYQRDNINYLIAAGADLASAATIIPTNEFHGVTGVTTIDNLTPVTPVAGQRIRLWIKGGPLTIRNNGGGTGNVRTATGGDRTFATNTIVEFAYDATNTVWREVGPASALLAIGFRTTSVSTAGASFGTGADLLGSALSFTADGVSSYLVECSAYDWSCTVAGGSQQSAAVNLDGVQNAWISSVNVPAASFAVPFTGRARIVTPAAGAHTVNIRLMTGAGTLTVDAGPGGAAGITPAIVLVRKET